MVEDSKEEEEEEEDVMESHHQQSTNSEISIVRAGEDWRVVHQFNSVDRDILKLKPNNPLQIFDLVESVLKIRLTALKEDMTQVIPLLKCFRKVCSLWKQVVETEVVLRSKYYWSSCGKSNRVAKENWGDWRDSNDLISADQIAEAFKMLSTYHSTFTNFRNGRNTYSRRFWKGPTGYHCSSIASQQSEIICGFSDGSLVYFHVGNQKRICRDTTYQPYLTDEKLGSSAVIGIFFAGNKAVVYGESNGYIISLDLNSSDRRIIYCGKEEGRLTEFQGNHQGWVALYSSGTYRVWNKGMIYVGEGLSDVQKLRVSGSYCLICSRNKIMSLSLINPSDIDKVLYSQGFFLPNTFDTNEKEFVVVDGHDGLVVRIEDFSVVQRFSWFKDFSVDLSMGSMNSDFWFLTYCQGKMVSLGLRELSCMKVMPEALKIVALKADEKKIVGVSDGLLHLWHF